MTFSSSFSQLYQECLLNLCLTSLLLPQLLILFVLLYILNFAIHLNQKNQLSDFKQWECTLDEDNKSGVNVENHHQDDHITYQCHLRAFRDHPSNRTYSVDCLYRLYSCLPFIALFDIFIDHFFLILNWLKKCNGAQGCFKILNDVGSGKKIYLSCKRYQERAEIDPLEFLWVHLALLMIPGFYQLENESFLGHFYTISFSTYFSKLIQSTENSH